MQIELLWWQGCPSTEKAFSELRGALADVGLQDEEPKLREIETDEQAQAEGFRGSPTILIDGVDRLEAGDGEPVGLSCRIYRRRDGGIAPTPDPADLRDALREALAR